MKSPIRIFIVDDQLFFIEGLKRVIEKEQDMEVVGHALNGNEAIRKIGEHLPDVVLMDVGMSGLDGMAATRQIKSDCPQTRVLFLTQHENKEYVLPALKIGASGYMLKRAEGDELLTAIRAVHAGGTFFDPAIAGVVAEDVRRERDAPTDPFDTLTDREREVLTLLAQGQTYQQIAEMLFISPKTVDFHRANILHKLGLSSRADLTRYAVQRGLIA